MTDNGGDNAKGKGEWLRIRRKLQGASIVALVCERRELVLQNWDIWGKKIGRKCVENIKLGLCRRKRERREKSRQERQ